MRKKSGKQKRNVTETQSKNQIHDGGELAPEGLDHSRVLARLKKVKGQIDGIERMILNKRYCVDIITQLRASESALRSIEGEVLKRHLRGCVHDALLMKDQKHIEHKIEEIVKLSLKTHQLLN